MGLEMISLKSDREIQAMRKAGRLTAQARALAGSCLLYTSDAADE